MVPRMVVIGVTTNTSSKLLWIASIQSSSVNNFSNHCSEKPWGGNVEYLDALNAEIVMMMLGSSRNKKIRIPTIHTPSINQSIFLFCLSIHFSLPSLQRIFHRQYDQKNQDQKDAGIRTCSLKIHQLNGLLVNSNRQEILSSSSDQEWRI